MSKFKLDDRVQISNQSLKTHGERGSVTHVWPFDDLYEIRLDKNMTVTVKGKNIVKLDGESKALTSDDSSEKIYYVYLHNDIFFQPTTIQEAFFESGIITEPDLVEIDLDAVIEFISEHKQEAGFVITGNKVYPITTKVYIEGLTEPD